MALERRAAKVANYEEEIKEAQQRANDARDAWRKARDDMRDAIRKARDERRAARGEPAAEEVDEALQDIIGTARDFAREIGSETRRLADDVLQSAGRDWHGRWREQWEKQFGKDWRGHWVFGGRRFRQWTTGDEGTNPFVSAILSRGGGLLALYVLNLLADGPRHGNDIMRQIEQRTLGSWSSNPGAIYPLLSSMEENALVQSQWEDPDKRTRRAYHITDVGLRELERLRGVLRPKLMEAIEVLHILYDDLYESKGGRSSATEGETSSSSTQASQIEPEPQEGDNDIGAAPSVTRGDEVPLHNLLRRLFSLKSNTLLGTSS
jgi:DNA-binding PadR family transcriptional regulator